ncbi:phosphatase PAP2 family protein [Lacinutrix sp. 5H-3-7-4]|uniref:phosphatase PAP2 family protein n=1 Tax=Lacinutrix sp. (strain 5H-3-7-4) TaxID=983544 RepID=UPI00020A3697|nr:phosphatase PAP2 family protein [Lacinutrix sp. 5H-3-7-4]AEH02241.1 phosphoesterase PA-phosphatase related protein [Lacinutrix sp. 5H-3-7-4]
MKNSILTFLLFTIIFNLNAQKSESPYEWDWTRDGIWTGAALAGTVGGVLIISEKDPFTTQEIEDFRARQDDINFIDKWAVGNYSENASNLSDIPFYLSFAAPMVMMFDDEANDHSGQLFGIYIESLATTSTLFTIAAGLSNRARPYVYNESTPLNKINRTTATRSFYSGHVAATTTATFFTAKVFQDFNPDSPAIPYIWAGAIVLPAAVGYLRIEAGQHFLTDVALGYALGALAGYYIPELHKKKKDSKIGFHPIMGQTRFGDNYQALSLTYTF